MWYVYSESIESGLQDFVDIFEDVKDAIARIRLCYDIDAKCGRKNCYYYFMKKH